MYDQHPAKDEQNRAFEKANSAVAGTFSISASANKLNVSIPNGNNSFDKHFLKCVYYLCNCRYRFFVVLVLSICRDKYVVLIYSIVILKAA